jgi:hypothetical protein
VCVGKDGHERADDDAAEDDEREGDRADGVLLGGDDGAAGSGRAGWSVAAPTGQNGVDQR